jgi:hypothetical protein
VLGLTEQGTGLIPYKFLINNKESNTLFAGELTQVKLGDQNRLKSVAYDNSKGQWTTRYWFVDSNHGILSAGDFAPDFFPANGPKDAASDAQLIFEAYLNYRTDPGIEGERRIKDYKIHTIQMERENQSGEFVFSAVYDILPASDQYVLAGNGVIDKDGWVRGKMHFVSVVRNTGSYTIMSMGTSP